MKIFLPGTETEKYYLFTNTYVAYSMLRNNYRVLYYKSIVFSSTGDWAQDSGQARQELYHWAVLLAMTSNSKDRILKSHLHFPYRTQSSGLHILVSWRSFEGMQARKHPMI